MSLRSDRVAHSYTADSGEHASMKEADLARLITTLGPKRTEDVGMVLPHEHVFVDLRTWDEHGYAQADPAEVITAMAPELDRARGPVSARSSSAARLALGGEPTS